MQVAVFLDSVYSGRLPTGKHELRAVMEVTSLLSNTRVKTERPDTVLAIHPATDTDTDRSNDVEMAAVETKVNLGELLPMNPIALTELLKEPHSRSALNMTREERLLKSAENLEKRCQFCSNSVSDHKVSLKVKQEKNNSYHVKNQYVCCVCGFVANNPSAFIAHNNQEFSKYTSAGEKLPPLWQFECPLCDISIQEHKSCDPSEGYICCHCKESFSSPGVLSIHLKTVKSASSRSVVEEQSPLKEKADFVPCMDCRKFKLKKEKMAHYKAQHPDHYKTLLKHNVDVWKSAPSSRYIHCDICNKNIRKCNLKDHKLNVHKVNMENMHVATTDVKPENICDICGHVSRYAKDVKKHKKFVHDKILNFACKYCGKKFSNKGNLNQHEVIHTGITPYQCHFCGKQCRRKTELEKHIESHSLGPGMFLTEEEVDLGQLPTVVTSAAPLLLPHLDTDTMRQADLLKDLTASTNTLGQPLKISAENQQNIYNRLSGPTISNNLMPFAPDIIKIKQN